MLMLYMHTYLIDHIVSHMYGSTVSCDIQIQETACLLAAQLVSIGGESVEHHDMVLPPLCTFVYLYCIYA